LDPSTGIYHRWRAASTQPEERQTLKNKAANKIIFFKEKNPLDPFRNI